MTLRNAGPRGGRDQRRHHLVFSDRRGQRPADESEWIGQHPFGYVGGGNSVEHQI